MSLYRIWVICIFFSFVGCFSSPIGQTVCRHDVLRDLAFLHENHFEARVAIYRVDLISSHAQAQIKKGNEWLWVGNWYGDVYLSNTPARKIEGWIIYYTPEEYIEEMGKSPHNLQKKLYK